MYVYTIFFFLYYDDDDRYDTDGFDAKPRRGYHLFVDGRRDVLHALHHALFASGPLSRFSSGTSAFTSL